MPVPISVNYLLDKCYFKLGNQISRQIIGIPMASDPAAFFADPFSFHYKSKGIKKVRKTVLGRERDLEMHSVSLMTLLPLMSQ